MPLQKGGNVAVSANWQYRDRVAYTDSNVGWLNEQDIVDVDIAWIPNDNFKVSFYGKNLLDEVQFGGDTQLPWPGPLSNGVNTPFDPNPAAGSFSPLKKGALMGIELSWNY